jgi:hypothetical protein
MRLWRNCPSMVKLALGVITPGILLAPSADGGMQRSEQSPQVRVALLVGELEEA